MRKCKPEEEDKWGLCNKTEIDSDTTEERFDRRDSQDGEEVQNTEWKVKSLVDWIVREKELRMGGGKWERGD